MPKIYPDIFLLQTESVNHLQNLPGYSVFHLLNTSLLCGLVNIINRYIENQQLFSKLIPLLIFEIQSINNPP